jgi:hypothetical protein
VLLPEVDKRLDGVEAGVLREGARDDVQRLGERFDRELLAAADGAGELAELHREFRLARAAAGQHAAVLEGRPNDA